ncbi:hypothetical protein [Roseateles amylovorans]|uniref:Uncharacterized protein n=1 Tax=Roseateles amylovorans TaxID=2978473 RepID=A0ABY6B9F2_9BURK|nr:hypothetical protein [Roseateles amylovorans]UXH80541.1 hypothetical protein N4261_11985 [Roseateles amylovorans]
MTTKTPSPTTHRPDADAPGRAVDPALHAKVDQLLSQAPLAQGVEPLGGAHIGGNDVQLPHERDQSTGADSTGAMGTGAAGAEQRDQMGQAHEDLRQGQVDTDMRATPGLDAQRREGLVPESTAKDSPTERTDRTPVRR